MTRMIGEITREELSQGLSNEIEKVYTSLHIKGAVERDFDTYVDIGVYRITNNNMPNKPPFDKVHYGILEVIPIPISNAIKQRAHDLEYNCTWFRSKPSDTAPWSSWEREARVTDITNPNLLINGGFDVWQSGDNIRNMASQSTKAYTADMWYFSHGNSVVGWANGVKHNLSGSESALTGCTYALKLELDRISGSSSELTTIIENGKQFVSMAGGADEYVTLSFYANATSTPIRYIYMRIGATTVTFEGSSPLTLEQKWKKYSFTVKLPKNDAVQAVTTAQLSFRFDPSEKLETIFITGIKLEHGRVATQYVPRLYGDELALCQRYYELIPFELTEPYTVYNCYKGLVIAPPVFYPKVEKRVTPTYSLKFIRDNGASKEVSYANAIGGSAVGQASVELEQSQTSGGARMFIKDFTPTVTEGHLKTIYTNGAGSEGATRGVSAIIADARFY